MFSLTPHMVHRGRLASFYLAILFVLVLPIVTLAQIGGIDPDPGSPGTGGRNTIEGRIYYPSGQTVDKRLKVRMSGLRGGDFFTRCDDNGVFSFRRIAGGSYTITVEAEGEFESASEQVDVIDAGSSRGTLYGRTYNIQIQLRYKKSSDKVGVINAALMSAPKAAADLYLKGVKAEREGDHERAIDHLQRALALHPRFSLALNELGLIQERLDKLDEAEKTFASAVEIEPQSYELRLNYGVVLLRNKHYEKANAQFQSAIKIKDIALPHLFRGKTLIFLRQYADAETELQSVIKTGGSEVALAYRFLGALYNERKEPLLAITALEKYLSLAPTAKDAASVREIIKQLRSQISKT